MAKMTSESFTIRKFFSTFSIIIKLHANKDKGLNLIKMKKYEKNIRPKKSRYNLKLAQNGHFLLHAFVH